MSNESIHMALHGYGYIGRLHVLASQLNAAAAVAAPRLVWDAAVVRSLDSEAAARAADHFSLVTDDLQALRHQPIDAIDIASPNAFHHAPFQLALDMGWGIYCEKPISHQLDEAQQMAQKVKEAGNVHQVALMYRFHPAVIEARDWLLSGQLGRALTFRAELLHGGYLNPSRTMSWRLQSGPSGGGAMMDLGIHLIDTLHTLLGRVESVTATTKTFVTRRSGQSGDEAVDVDDWASATLQMASGAVGTVEVSRVHYGRERDFIDIVCEHGVLHIPLEEYRGVEVHTYRTDLIAPERPHGSILQPLGAKFAQSTLLNLHATSLAAFARRVRGGTVGIPVPTFEDAVLAQQVVAAAMASGDKAGVRIQVG
ncbi:Gfo/Idh/MocA family protein [Alicyclobacillus fastidiosus]|uniref:Gfo/Idh/MocA family oxidoreductase n=1 Tax=Alicyclobacillus fastidiosus TaxID=392011 RepID=A0ABV5ADD1_9BACL|nr:Gfo/Idh/MocA family oxidoreductase [Alicyclobacillus fastidiosus]WEH08758.1 Gfo/Idh/MocA family oxidoreductase [Alicyclobacillus fastidiosus]